MAGSLIYRELKPKDLLKILVDTAANTSLVLLIIGCAGAFTWVLTIKGIAAAIGSWFAAVSSGKFVFMALTILLLLFMGCFMECCASVLLVVPILLPVATSLNIDPVYFGVIIVMTLSLGMATPPVGEDLYIAASIAGIKFEQEVKYVMPLVGAAILAIIICAAVPGIVTFLPNLIYG
ncbi:MAG: TRAP transporter large permease subunit [Oscillibacter sp.]|nr:TRAP transporter large permease subunit [Oscillibacter sp.]